MGIGRLLKNCDHLVSKAYLGSIGERSALIGFLFHGLFADDAELNGCRDMAPLQRTTVATFRTFIEYFLESGYTFVGPDDILAGLPAGRKSVLITFDDGYFNNFRALDALAEFKVPSLFFVSTNHIQQQKCFWWDVLHREGKRLGWSDDRVEAESDRLKVKTNADIEADLRQAFGEGCLRPLSDLDRPMSPSELADFARRPYVHIGSHSADHAILTNYPEAEMRSQIALAQEAIREMIGKAPDTIAYPNGNFSPAIMRAAQDCGLKLGFSCERRKVRLPYTPDSGLERMHLGRFSLRGNHNLDFQLTNVRSDVSPYGMFKSWSTSRY